MSLRLCGLASLVIAALLGRGERAWAIPDPALAMERARSAAHEAATAVRAAAVVRDDARHRLGVAPGPTACANVAEAGAALDAAWGRYLADLAGLAPLVGTDEQAATAATRRAAEAERLADQQHDQALARFCAALPATAEAPTPPPAEATPVCGLVRQGELLVWVDAAPVTAGTGLAVAQHLAGRFADELDFLFVLVPGIDGALAEQASAWFERGLPGLGAPARHAAGLLPGWRRLLGAVVLDAATGLRAGPSLRGLARAFGNRWSLPGCSPTPGGGWGYADVGGQLGGFRLLRREPGGRWSAAPARVDGQPGLVGNGGNSLPYAPVERYLLGLTPLDGLPSLTFLRDPRPDAGGVAAAGTCRLTPADIRARFGERPPHPAPYQVGVVLLTPTRPGPAEVARLRADALAFTAPGPDDDPWLLNYFEATGGAGRLDLRVPAPRGCADRAAGLP
ncbi:MAG: hypothetical protein H6706_05670 [Myxococcales bacterium]|nr:hypothetical protein [Myxococcales bacterium]